MNIRSRILGGKAADEPLLKGKQPKGVKADTLDSVPVVREASRTANTRDQDRHRLADDEQVRLVHRGKERTVQLVNLSGGGAMIAGKFNPKLWDRVELHLGEDGVLECAVCWIKGDRVGLEFAHETQLDCSPDERAVLLRDVIARSFPDVEFEVGVVAAPAPAEGRQADEQRGDRRHPLIWSGTLHYDFQSSAVRLRNISEKGALIECETPLPVGAEPLLDLGEAGNLFGTVTWSVGDQAGIRFHSPFDMSQLARAKPQLAPVRWERPPYLKTDPTANSPWAKEWGRMSLNELRDELEGFLKR
jgi:hypothetical protein